jgi:hypothetical protein
MIKPILQYNYGNQITHSNVTIDATGVVQIRERTTAGGKDIVTEKKLSAEELQTLKSYIATVAQAPSGVKVKGEIMGFGSKVGELSVSNDGAAFATVRGVDVMLRKPKEIRQSSASAASLAIIHLVNQFSKLDMPDDPSKT